MKTKELLAKSWSATERRIASLDDRSMNEASAAGMFLAQAGGDAGRALGAIPRLADDEDGARFLTVVRGYLQRAVDEENGTTEAEKSHEAEEDPDSQLPRN